MENSIYLEEARKLPVFDEADILIVGAGAAGHSAAVAAARAGAKNIVVLERYGYMGGWYLADMFCKFRHLLGTKNPVWRHKSITICTS